jgi:hypothetical protein
MPMSSTSSPTAASRSSCVIPASTRRNSSSSRTAYVPFDSFGYRYTASERFSIDRELKIHVNSSNRLVHETHVASSSGMALRPNRRRGCTPQARVSDRAQIYRRPKGPTNHFGRHLLSRCGLQGQVLYWARRAATIDRPRRDPQYGFIVIVGVVTRRIRSTRTCLAPG